MKKPKTPKCPRCGSHHLFVDKSGENGTWKAKCGDCLKIFPYEQDHFKGEMMTCAVCGKQEQSAPDKTTEWRLLQLNGRDFYVCVDHFPADGAPKEAFADAYEDILRKLLTLLRTDD